MNRIRIEYHFLQASGPQLGFLIQTLAGLGGAVAIGLIYSWQLTLVLLAFAPLIILSGIVSVKQSANVNRSNSRKTQKAAAVNIVEKSI